MKQQQILTAIKNVTIINKKAIEIKKLVEVLFVGTVFVETIFIVSIVSSHITTESSIMLPKYLPFLQLHGVGFKI